MREETIHYYLIPGMGADHRLFQHFRLEHGEVHYLNWKHHRDSRNLADYARIMAEDITTERNVIIGSSMGGMVTVELAKIVRPEAAILVSAPTGRHEFPPVLKAVNAMRIHRALKPAQIGKITSLADLFMGFKNAEQRALFYDMLKGNGNDFLHFSIRAVLEWNNTEMPDIPFVQIIGSEDRLFTKKRSPQAIIVEGSGHFTAFEKATEVSEIINTYVRENILR